MGTAVVKPSVRETEALCARWSFKSIVNDTDLIFPAQTEASYVDTRVKLYVPRQI